jgi:hypothetical protein
MTTKIILNKIDGIDKGTVKLKPEDLSSKVGFSEWISENFEIYSVKKISDDKLLPLLSYIKRLFKEQNLDKETRDKFIENINDLMEALKEDEQAK